MNPVPFVATVWGPHYWFFLHTITHSYPSQPNQITKRKYYDLIMNMPLFIPDGEIGSYFSELITHYPVTPYLDTRESFIRWMIFIHNKVNLKLGYKDVPYQEAIDMYYREYEPKPVYLSNKIKINKKWIVSGIIIGVCIGILVTNGYYIYKPLVV